MDTQMYPTAYGQLHQELPTHSDISDPSTAPAHLPFWLDHMAQISSDLTFSDGSTIKDHEMLTLNSKKPEGTIDYIPTAAINPGPQCSQGERASYRDMVNAYINDRKALATLNNRLLINMNVDDANAIRQEYKDNLTTRSIMQYLEDTYGIMGAQHLALLQQTALIWDPKKSAKMNFSHLAEIWRVLGYTDTMRFMSLMDILKPHPAASGLLQKFTTDHPMSTDIAELKKFLIQRLPMGTHSTINSISSADISQMQIAQISLNMEALQAQQQEMLQQIAALQRSSTTTQPQTTLKYCFFHGYQDTHHGGACKVMATPNRNASDGQPYTKAMKNSRDGRANDGTRQLTGNLTTK